MSSTASALSQPVNRAASSVTPAALTPSTQGRPATFTAMVAATAPGAGTPTGTVSFKDGATTLGTGRLSVAGGMDQATFRISSLGVGPHAITASTSAAATQYVNTNLSGYNLSNANLKGAYFVGVSLGAPGWTTPI